MNKLLLTLTLLLTTLVCTAQVQEYGSLHNQERCTSGEVQKDYIVTTFCNNRKKEAAEGKLLKQLVPYPATDDETLYYTAKLLSNNQIMSQRHEIFTVDRDIEKDITTWLGKQPTSYFYGSTGETVYSWEIIPVMAGLLEINLLEFNRVNLSIKESVYTFYFSK